MTGKTILDLQKHQEEMRTAPPVWLCQKEGTRVRVHLAGLGDVGRTTLTALSLLGGDVIESLGIYDLNAGQMRRLELELNQICDPFDGRRIPPVYMLSERDLFDCEVFVFCVARQVPEVGTEQGDVRMAQFETNRAIAAWYGQSAAKVGYCGLFLVMSDPVELLCRAVLLASREGNQGLLPGQIQGCGLGVMHGRACFLARREDAFRDYLAEGRVFGSHGRELVAANSIREESYDDTCSRGLTERVVRANLQVRECGFKPYIAPACSSGALTILRILKGQWNYSSNDLGGVYFGGKNRTTEHGIEWEILPLPELLFERLKCAYQNLEKSYCIGRMPCSERTTPRER